MFGSVSSENIENYFKITDEGNPVANWCQAHFSWVFQDYENNDIGYRKSFGTAGTTRDYREFFTGTLTPPPNAAKIAIYCYVGKGSGAAYFDDIKVYEVD